MRTAKELLIASKEFAHETRWLSWWHLASTLAVLAGLAFVCIGNFHWAIQLPASIMLGLTAVRMFIIYHDFQHSAILQRSKLASVIMSFYGLLMLNPASVWKRSHDHHHKNNSKTFGASIGSFPIMTETTYANSSSSEKFAYAAARHPLTIIFGYFTVFFWGMCLRPCMQSWDRHWDGAAAIAVNLSVMLGLYLVGGTSVLIFAGVIPMFVATALGAYLFYAQHNFPAAKIKTRSEWSHVEAALHSSSFITMNPLMHWFTGNIGYHHVHHLNHRIPFYRLPDAMANLEEMQSPGTTTLRPRDVLHCLKLKLWSPELDEFVGFGRPSFVANPDAADEVIEHEHDHDHDDDHNHDHHSHSEPADTRRVG